MTFRAGDIQRPALQGFDIQTGAVLIVDDRTGIAYLRSPAGTTYQCRPGESDFLKIDSNRVLSIEQLCDRFPALVDYALNKVDPEYITISTTSEGGKSISAQLVLGNLGLTARGYDPGNLDNRIEVIYEYDAEGRLQSIVRDDQVHQITRASADHSELAPMYPYNTNTQNDFEYISVQSHIPGKPDLFEPQNAIRLIQNISIERAEADRNTVNAILATESGQAEHRKGVQPRSTIFGISISRFALILSGLLVIGIGSLAWWKNRS